MDKSVLRRLESLERTTPAPEVALLLLQDNGLWELVQAGKQQRRSLYKDIESAKRRLRGESTWIIVDI